ncbi:hypothetical protein HMPREF1495_1318 [Lachnoanaerobaculum sp. MSX33]|nr:hypothetical protein HMPREF1495_1318 [Lachnoanaerobaculum sp. MSX33]
MLFVLECFNSLDFFQFFLCWLCRLKCLRNKLPYKVEIDFNLLSSLNAAFSATLMNEDLFHELIQHGGGQFIEAFILINQSYKAISRFLSLFNGLKISFKFCTLYLQSPLFLCILPIKKRISVIRQLAKHIILIDADNQFFQICNALFHFIHAIFLQLKLCCLLTFLCFLNNLQKFFPVILRILCDCLQHGLNGINYRISINSMLGFASSTDRHFAISRTSILRNSFSIGNTMNIHFCPAVSAIHQSGQRMCFTPTIRIPPDITAKPLNNIIGFLINNRFLRIFKDDPLILRNIMTFLIFEVLPSLEINCVTKVLSLLENVHDGGRSPVIRILEGLVLVQALSKPGHVNRRNLDLFLFQQRSNLIGAETFNRPSEYLSDDGSCFRIHDPVIAVMLILEIAIRTAACDMLTGISFCQKCGFDLFTGISRIPFVHDIAERGKVIIPTKAINPIVQGNQTDVTLPKHFHELTNLKIITAHTAHIFDYDGTYIPGFNFFHHGYEARSIKPGAGYSVIRKMQIWRKIIIFRIVFKHLFLIGYAFRFSLQFVIMA